MFSIHDAAKLIGTLVAASPAIPYSPLYIRQMEYEKTLALNDNCNDFSKLMSFSHESLEDLKWWLDNLQISGAPIRQDKFNLTITSNASMTGWGAHCNGKSTRGFWTLDQKKLNINNLELIAAFNGLKVFGRHSNQQILLRIDNKTAIAYINKFGGCRSVGAHKIAKQIWGWCQDRNIWIFASYISTKENYLADLESRSEIDSSDFSLNSSVYDSFCLEFGEPGIDLFATHITAKCKRFLSWYPDPYSEGVDAFTIQWKEFFYCFPPFILIPRVLRKIKSDKAMGIVVVPNWPSQPWYPEYKNLVTSKILYFGPKNNLIVCPYSNRPHPLNKQLVLAVAILSGRV